MDEVTVTADVRADADGPWRFLRIPPEVRRTLAGGARGAVPVTARLGEREWATSLLPWADGAAQLNLPKGVREAAGVTTGDEVTVRLAPREKESRGGP